MCYRMMIFYIRKTHSPCCVLYRKRFPLKFSFAFITPCGTSQTFYTRRKGGKRGFVRAYTFSPGTCRLPTSVSVLHSFKSRQWVSAQDKKYTLDFEHIKDLIEVSYEIISSNMCQSFVHPHQSQEKICGGFQRERKDPGFI